MVINKRGVSILLAMCLAVCAYAQDSLRVSGAGNDTLTLQHSTVTAKSREQKLREGAFAVGALNIRLQASTLQSLTQAIDKTAGIRIREEGGVGSDFDLSINGMSGNSIRYFLDGMPLDAKGTGITLANLPVNIIDRVEIYKGVAEFEPCHHSIEGGRIHPIRLCSIAELILATVANAACIACEEHHHRRMALDGLAILRSDFDGA